jgi:hypothetical protein
LKNNNLAVGLKLSLFFLIFIPTAFLKESFAVSLPKILIENVEIAGKDNAFKTSYLVNYYDNVVEVHFKNTPNSQNIQSF